MKDVKEVFERLRMEQPVGGDVLGTVDDKPIRVTVRSKEIGGAIRRIVFCRAKIDTQRGCWVLHDGSVGIVCMILPEAQNRLKKDDTGNYTVSKLKVFRYTESKKAMMCEVIE